MVEGLDWSPIVIEKSSWLERLFMEEIRSVVFKMDREKASGHDGFTMAYYHSNWIVVKEDLISVFHEFFATTVIGKNINSTFITLVPKKDRSVKVTDFRPISFVTSVYKILTKVLSKRLGSIVWDIILDSQSVFVGGRQIINATLVANEVVEDVHRRERRALCLS